MCVTIPSLSKSDVPKMIGPQEGALLAGFDLEN